MCICSRLEGVEVRFLVCFVDLCVVLEETQKFAKEIGNEIGKTWESHLS